MWTSYARRYRTSGGDDLLPVPEHGDGRTEKRDQYELLQRLNQSLDRNNDVIQQALQTMEKMADSLNSLSKKSEGESTILDMKRDDKVVVEIKTTFLKIIDIDTVKQQFDAEIFVQAKWEEPLLHSVLSEQHLTTGEDIDKLIPWDPKLIIMNTDDAFSLDRKTFDLRFHEPGYSHPVVLLLWRFKGVFKENLELEHFPVDVQDLTISISTERSDQEVELIEERTALSSINVKAFMDAQEWTLYKHVECYRDVTTVEYCSSTVHPILHVQCRVARKVGFFLWNVLFIMLLILSLTFVAYAIDYEESERIVTSSTLFLTAVAFKLVVQESLPTISYLTYLDYYVLGALIFLGLQNAQNAAMMAAIRFMPKEDVNFYDEWSMIGLLLLLFVCHLIYGFGIYKTASRKWRIMKDKDHMYQSKMEFLAQFGSLPSRYDSPVEAESEDFFLPVGVKSINDSKG